MQRKRYNAPKKKKSRWFGNLVLTLLLLVGLALVFNQPIKNFIINYMGKQNQVNKLTADKIKANEKKDASFDFDGVNELDMESVLKAGLDSKNLSQLGGIAIPSLDLNLPIFKGTSETALSAGAGTMKPDQKMGEGNYALASHRTYSEDLLFAPLKNIKIGATIYLTDLEYVYTYKVVTKKYINPTDVDVIENHGTKREVTLITCNLDGTQRLLVQGDFVKGTPIKKASKKMIKAFDLKKKALI